MYLGMNRREMSGLLALVGAVILGIAAQSHIRRQNAGDVWIEHDLNDSRKTHSAIVGQGAVGDKSRSGSAESPQPSKFPTGAFVENGRLDLNRARVEDLETLLGIGPKKAEAIVAHRRQNGPFTSTRQIMNVGGIGELTWRSIEALLWVDPPAGDGAAARSGDNPSSPTLPSARSIPSAAPPSPNPALPPPAVNINTATVDELQALWNVGPVKAQAIVQYRIQHGLFRRPQDLEKVPGVGPETLTRNRRLIRVK